LRQQNTTMALQTFPFLAFFKKAPTARPARGTVHLRYDSENNNLIIVDSAGNTKSIASGDANATSGPEASTIMKRSSDGSSAIAYQFDMYDPDGVANATFLANGSLSDGVDRTYSLPQASGTLGVLRNYVDSASANAAVSVGDAWWDTTLKKVRVRLA
jgi:hypothetical protein